MEPQKKLYSCEEFNDGKIKLSKVGDLQDIQNEVGACV